MNFWKYNDNVKRQFLFVHGVKDRNSRSWSVISWSWPVMTLWLTDRLTDQLWLTAWPTSLTDCLTDHLIDCLTNHLSKIVQWVQNYMHVNFQHARSNIYRVIYIFRDNTIWRNFFLKFFLLKFLNNVKNCNFKKWINIVIL